MFKHSKKFVLSAAVVAIVSAGGVAMAGNKDLKDHEFVDGTGSGFKIVADNVQARPRQADRALGGAY